MAKEINNNDNEHRDMCYAETKANETNTDFLTGLLCYGESKAQCP